jgi:hypothetical protein
MDFPLEKFFAKPAKILKAIFVKIFVKIFGENGVIWRGEKLR